MKANKPFLGTHYGRLSYDSLINFVTMWVFMKHHDDIYVQFVKSDVHILDADIKLTPEQNSLLNKGATFAPSPQLYMKGLDSIQFLAESFRKDAVNVINHVHRICVPLTNSNFVRTPKIHKHALDIKNIVANRRRYTPEETTYNSENSTHTLLSNFELNKIHRFELKHGICFNQLINESVYLNMQHTHYLPHNLTRKEWFGLKELSHNNNILILPTDKNLGLSVIKTDTYILRMNEALVKQRHTFDNVTKFRANMSQLTRARLIRNFRIVLFHTRISHMKQFSTILKQSKVTWLNKSHIIAHVMIPIRSRISTKITNVPLFQVPPQYTTTTTSDMIQTAYYHNSPPMNR